MPDFRNINPVTFFYEQDSDLIFNQNKFATQQGLDLNLVNALSGLRDETILNYSNIFLTKSLPINDIVTLPSRSQNLIFSTYLALSALSGVNINTKYVTLSTNPSLSAAVTLSKSLSDSEYTYFAIQTINGIQCRITSISDNLSKNLTFDPSSYNCEFTVETPYISSNKLNFFEYSLDDNGFLKLYFRSNNAFYIIRNVENKLSAVNVTTTSPVSTDVIATIYNLNEEVKFKNNFVYYDKSTLKDFNIDVSESVLNVPQNHVLYYNYQSDKNFLSGGLVNVDFFKNKNVLSNNYFINDKLPFSKNDVLQREYTTILSKQNSELYEGNLQFNYNYYTKEYLFLPDVTTKFSLPGTLYPYSVINVDDSNLVNAGSYGGLSPVYSDKVIKNLNPNTNTVNYNEANGIYLYTWLYTDTNQLTSYWLDRFYFPKKTSVNVAYSGTPEQVFNYTSALSTFLNTNYPTNNYLYYDIRSSLTLEPSASYRYSRIGNNYINKVVNTYQKAVSSFVLFDSNNVEQNFTNTNIFANNGYGEFKIPQSSNNSFTISLDLNSSNVDNIKSNLIVGNNFDEGLSLYKGGVSNIFTPGYIINSLTGIDVFDLNNLNLFSLNLSSYVGAPAIVLDIINTGFDHLLKIFYVRTDNNIPGFLDFSIYNKIFNKYEFNSLNNVFRIGQRINLFGKTYKGNNEIYYLVKDSNPSNPARIYRFDYLNNNFISPSVSLSPTNAKDYIFNLVSINDTLAGTTTLSGFDGGLLDGFIGVSKLYNTVYFRNLSSNTTLGNTTQYATLCSLGGGIFDVAVYGDKFYVQTNGSVNSYDKYKRLYNTYITNSSAVSGIKIDFINNNFETKLLSYTADVNGRIIVDRFNLETTELENSFNTGIKVNPIFFKEYQYPKKAKYTNLLGIGLINNSFVSGGVEYSYTYSNPLIGSLTALPINAIVGGISDDVNVTNNYISGGLYCYGVPIPSDVSLELYEGSTLLQTVTSDGNVFSLNIVYNNNVKKYVPYSLVCSRTLNDNLVVSLGLDINGGTFYNGSFRNVVVGPQYQLYSPSNQGFANAFFAYVNNSLTDQYGYVQGASARKMNENYGFISPAQYFSNVNFNNTTTNPYNNFYHLQTSPQLRLVANPDYSTFQPSFLTFNSEEDPPTTSSEIISGAPFQVPTNLSIINQINQFDKGDMVARVDLYSGNNYQNKQTQIVPFDVDNNSQIVMSFDVTNGFLKIYNNAKLVKNVSLSADTFYTSYFLYNNFGVGMPIINNKAASTLSLNYSAYPTNYSIENFVVYNRPLNVDEIKFNFLKNKNIDPINFDITSGTRNDTDTVTSFNKLVIPGRKNNDVKIYIKNAFLDDAGKSQLNAQLIEKVRNILPINTSNIEFKYIDYESN